METANEKKKICSYRVYMQLQNDNEIQEKCEYLFSLY